VRANVTSSQITVEWNDIADITAAYNVVIWDETSGTVISNIPVNPSLETVSVADGKETAVRPGIGTYTVKAPVVKGRETALPAYKIGVQAVSLYNEKYSTISWADEVSGVEDIATSTDAGVKVTVDGDNVTVKASGDCDVKIIDMLGRTVATGVANTPLRLAAAGVFIVLTPGNTVKISK